MTIKSCWIWSTNTVKHFQAKNIVNFSISPPELSGPFPLEFRNYTSSIRKLEMVEKFDDMCVHLDTTPQRNGRWYNNIVLWSRYNKMKYSVIIQQETSFLWCKISHSAVTPEPKSSVVVVLLTFDCNHAPSETWQVFKSEFNFRRITHQLGIFLQTKIKHIYVHLQLATDIYW